MQETQTILHPTDFCGRCEYAFRLACSRASEQGARLVVLHVAPPPVYGVIRMQAEEYQRLWQALQQIRAPDPGVCLEHLLRCGDPAQQILGSRKSCAPASSSWASMNGPG